MRDVFASDEKGLTKAATSARLFVVSVLIVAGKWILEPDIFGLVPNGLDPMFYTGYSLNLSDALAAAGNTQYFVTRWSSYLPTHVFSILFGPYWGRLLVRLAMLLVLVEMTWRFLYRFRIKAHARLVGLMVLVSAPMFLRAFATDYPEHLIIWSSLVLLLLSLDEETSLLRSISIGVLSAGIIIANPFASVLVFCIYLNQTQSVRRSSNNAQFWMQQIIILISSLATILFGFLLFKFHYEVANIYEPTLETIRNFASSAQSPLDGWRAPTRNWLLYFGWLYLPLIYLVISFRWVSNKTPLGVVLLKLQILVALILLFHIFMEFRSGHALETSYYWSMLLPPALLLCTFLVSYALNQVKSQWSFIIVLSVFVLLRLEIPQFVRIGHGAYLLSFIAALVFALLLLRSTRPLAFAILLVTGSIWLQSGSPNYEQTTNGGNLNSPRYDLVYGERSTVSRKILDETIWFLEQMDEIPMDSSAVFLPLGDWAAPIVGTYIAQPFGRVLSPQSRTKVFSEEVRSLLTFGYRPLLVIYGEDVESENLLLRVRRELPQSSVFLDVLHGSGLQYRLIAVLTYGKFPTE